MEEDDPVKILIVEDEEDNIGVILAIFEYAQMKHEVLIARDGAEAIRMAYDGRPDLILMDLTLPRLSGWEAARSLKNDPTLRHIPILALTANAMFGDRDRALEAGCDDYYPKPIEIDSFLDFLKPHLSKIESAAVPPSDAVSPASEPPAGPPAETGLSPDGESDVQTSLDDNDLNHPQGD